MRLSKLLLLALFAPAAAALEAAAPGPEWIEAKRSEELVIFYRDDAKLQAREVLAIAEADLPPAIVFGVTEDYEHFTEFMPRVKEARVLARESDAEVVIYERIGLPVINDRECVLRVHRRFGDRDGTGVFRSDWHVVPSELPVPSGVVRLTLSSGSWTMEPLEGGKRTRMTYRLLTSPDGMIPKWLAAKSNTKGIPDLFRAIRERAHLELQKRQPTGTDSERTAPGVAGEERGGKGS